MQKLQGEESTRSIFHQNKCFFTTFVHDKAVNPTDEALTARNANTIFLLKEIIIPMKENVVLSVYILRKVSQHATSIMLIQLNDVSPSHARTIVQNKKCAINTTVEKNFKYFPRD